MAAPTGGATAAPTPPAPPPPPLIAWTPAPGLTADPASPGPRLGHVAALIPAAASAWGDDLVIVHGGLGPDRWALGDVACLQVGSGEWVRPAVTGAQAAAAGPSTTVAADGTLLPPPPATPAARAFHASASIGAVLFIFGGHAWTPGSGGGGGSPDGKGGNGRVVKHGDLWALCCNEWVWTRLHAGSGSAAATAPVPRDFSALAPLPDGRLLLVGGLDAADRRLDDAWVFDPSTAAASGGVAGWTPLLPPAPSGPGRGLASASQARPKARYGHSLMAVGDRVFLFGGETAAGPSAELWALRGATAAGPSSSSRPPSDAGGGGGSNLLDAPGPSWIALDLPGPVPTPRKGHAAAALGAWLVFWGGRTLDPPPPPAGGGLPLLRPRAGPGTERVLSGPPAVMDRVGRVCWRTDPSPSAASSAAPASAPSTPPPREFATLTPLPGGRLLLLGGGSGGVVWGDAWVGDTALAPFAGPAAQEAAPAASAAAAAQAAASAAAAAAASAVGGLPSLLRLPTRALGGLLLGRTGSGGGGGAGGGGLTPLSGASSEDGEGGGGGNGRRRSGRRHGRHHPRPWWSASPAAPEFLALRRKVGLDAPAGPGPSRLGAGAPAVLPPPAAGTVGAALAALAALQPGGPAFRGGLGSEAAAGCASAAALAAAPLSAAARFIGVEADGVRLGEVDALVAAAGGGRA
jgi:hypothetical protein